MKVILVKDDPPGRSCFEPYVPDFFRVWTCVYCEEVVPWKEERCPVCGSYREMSLKWLIELKQK